MLVVIILFVFLYVIVISYDLHVLACIHKLHTLCSRVIDLHKLSFVCWDVLLLFVCNNFVVFHVCCLTLVVQCIYFVCVLFFFKLFRNIDMLLCFSFRLLFYFVYWFRVVLLYKSTLVEPHCCPLAKHRTTAKQVKKVMGLKNND